MRTNKLLSKLESFFDLPAQKQEKKHHKLLKIIDKLEARRAALEEELIAAGKADDTSSEYHELRKEVKVVSKLIKRAKQHDARD